MHDPIASRQSVARAIAQEAGTLALGHFRNLAALKVELKGPQDLVSEADRATEILIRRRIAETFPQDAIKGEEENDTPGDSGFTWVIDPIDGTANFLNAIPAWCVVLAVVQGAETVAAVIYDPVHGETCHAIRGGGAFCNDGPIAVRSDASIIDGTIGFGLSRRSDRSETLAVLQRILERGGLFYRNASGALSLSFVARGRLLGYIELHMNPWDCLAGQLLVAEAGGRTEPQNAQSMLIHGGRVVVGAPGVWDDLGAIAAGLPAQNPV